MGDRQSTIQVIELNAIGGWHTLHSNIYLAVTGVGRCLTSNVALVDRIRSCNTDRRRELFSGIRH